MGGRKLSLRLTPYQERVLEAARTHELPLGAKPRAAAQVFIVAMLEHARRMGIAPIAAAPAAPAAPAATPASSDDDEL